MSRGVRVLIGAVAVAAVAVAGVFAVRVLGSDSSARAETGDCLTAAEVPVTLSGDVPLQSGPAEPVGCEDSAAAYRVALGLDGAQRRCPSEIYRVRREQGGPSESRTLCLTYNVEAGGCFVELPADAGPFDCARGPRPGAIKILRVLDGVEDPRRCGDIDEPGLIAVTVPEPATTFCYVPFSSPDDGGLSV